MSLLLGLDIGTTTLSAAVVDLGSVQLLEAFSQSHRSDLPAAQPHHSLQDPEKILSLLLDMVDTLLKRYPTVAAIGLTGQMHGILYTNIAGQAVSPLYTWQDGRGDEPTPSGPSWCEEIREKTGLPIYTGYGLATHYYNTHNGLVPTDAVKLCTVMDWAAMALTGRTRPLCHTTNAASLGLFDLAENAFQICDLDLEPAFLPEVTGENKIVGYYKGIPVSVAIGDNQASVFGSLREEGRSLSLNYGTGSQISAITEHPVSAPGLETRPYIGGKYLVCGSALCGGRAYAILETFFRSYLGVEEEQYTRMETLGLQALDEGGKPLVFPQFSGTRQSPTLRGRIENLSDRNFTPGALILGTVQGMADELYALYTTMALEGRDRLILSGNGIRKNALLRRAVRDTYGMALYAPAHREEAAFGAALYAAVCAGLGDEDAVKHCIRLDMVQD